MAEMRQRPGGGYAPLPADPLALTDDPYWTELPDILQAQVRALPPRPRPPVASWPGARACALTSVFAGAAAQVLVQLKSDGKDKLLWAGAPIIRTHTILTLFAVWAFLLTVPVLLLVELVEETGGWWAIAWAIVSVFIFVPRISQGSRVVFALTTQRAFVSVRTMHCSIETSSIDYAQVSAMRADVRSDGTGEIVLRKKGDEYDQGAVRIYNVKGFRDACRVLEARLPPRVVEQAGLRDVLSESDDRSDSEPEADSEGEVETERKD
jgi:hypothetical protein